MGAELLTDGPQGSSNLSQQLLLLLTILAGIGSWFRVSLELSGRWSRGSDHEAAVVQWQGKDFGKIAVVRRHDFEF